MPPQQLRDGLITLGAVLAPALVVVIENHLDTADPVVMEGDAILMAQRSMFCTRKKSKIGEVLPLLLCYTVPCAEDQLKAKAPWHENVIQAKVFVLMIGNVILGAGTPLFEGKPTVSLRPIDLRKWDDTDNVLVRYEVRHKSV